MYRRNKINTTVKPKVIGLFRNCLRIIRDLDPKYQKTYYDYTKLKFKQFANLVGEKEILMKVNGNILFNNILLFYWYMMGIDANEEIDWLKTVIALKKSESTVNLK